MAVDKLLPRELKSLETQRKILDTAEQMLAQYDFKYLTVRNICETAGVASGSFYHHFGTKENVLIHCGKRLLHRNLRENPCPEDIDPFDYLHRAMWYGLILARFCDALGKEYVRTLYLSGEDTTDMFSEIYDRYLFPDLDAAMANGYVKIHFADPQDEQLVLRNIKKDVRIVSRGTALYWCTSKDTEEPFSFTMEHMIYRVLTGTRSDKQVDSSHVGHRLLSDTPYAEKIHIITFADYKAGESGED